MRISIAALIVLARTLGAQTDSLPRRAFLGAALGPNPNGPGVLVRSAAANTAAAQGGMRANDIITRLDTTDIGGPPQMSAALRALHPGQRAAFVVTRDGHPTTLSITMAARPVEQAPDFDITYTSVLVDGARRRVIVTRPRGAGRHPAVLMVGGIGCYSFDDGGGSPSAYGQILYHLTRRGFVTVRVEKSGVGDSEGPPCSHVDFNTEAAGYTAALHAMEQYPFVDPTHVFLFGHSIGGIEAPMIAGRDTTIRGLIVMSTTGIAWFEYELVNLRRQLALLGSAPDSIDMAMRDKERCMHQLLIDRESPDQVATDSTCKPYVQYPAHYTYMQQVAALNVGSLWRDVRARVLVIYPTSDFITSEADHRSLVDAINLMHPGRATFATVAGTDHYLATEESEKASITDSRPPFTRPFSPAVFPVLDAWLDGVT